MKKYLLKLLNEDQGTDPHFRRTMIVLQVITLAALFAIIVVVNTINIIPYSSWILSLLFALVTVSLILAVRGYLVPGRILVPISLVVAITAIIHQGNGVHDTATFAFPVVVLLGGMLIGRRGIWPLALMCMAGIAFVAYHEINGLIVTSYGANTGWDDVLINAALLAASASILRWLMGRMNDSLLRAQENEKALRDSEEKFSKAFRSTPTAVVIVGLESGLVLEINKSFETIFGHIVANVIGQNIIDLNIYHDPQDDLTLKEILLKEGRFENKELVGRRSDGGTLNVRVSAELTEIKGETCVISTLEDITEFKKADEARRRSEELYRRAIITAGAVPYYLDHRTRTYTYMGEGILQMTGYSVNEMNPDLWESLEQEGFPRGKLAHLTYEEADELTEKDNSIPWECDYRILTRDGQTRWVADTSVKGLNEFGENVGVIGILQDITDRKLAELERERLIKDLETRNAELERFTYTVSHDLKSPLVTIQGFLGYLEQDALAGRIDRVRQDSQRIKDATGKMQRLLAELLELSRIGRTMNQPEDAAFSEIVHEALKIVEGQIKNRGVKITFSSDLPTIHGDKARLIEVVQNLVDNACKYMGDQTQPQIEIGHILGQDGRSVFYVRDNGMGIEPKYHERIFGLFNKLDPQSEGTGIGLALVKRIVEVHGGRIWVESKGSGKGSTFYFTIMMKNT
jgi:PAS domain S-box-containing protein